MINALQKGEQSQWKRFFFAAALFNFIIGLAAMLVPQSTLDGRMIGLLVFSFGLLFLLLARDPLRYGATLWAGVIGKLGIVGLLGPQTLAGEGNPLMIVILAIELVFALGFLVYLFNRPDEAE